MAITEDEKRILDAWPALTKEDMARLNGLFPRYLFWRREKRDGGVTGYETARGGIEQRCRGGDDNARSNDGAFFHNGSLIDAAVAAHECPVLDNGRKGTRRLQHAANLGAGRQMNVFADLRAGPHGDMAVHHGAFTYIGPYVDIGRGHDNGAFGYESTAPDAGPAGDDADAVLCAELPHRVSILVKEGKLTFTHVCDGAQPEAGKNYFLHVLVYLPYAVCLPGTAEFSLFQGFYDFVKLLYCNFH